MELDLLHIGRALVGANTVSSRGTAPAVAVLKPLFEQLGWRTEIQEMPAGPGVRQQNLLARAPGPQRGEGLLWVTHLDTVEPGPREHWRSDPFVLTQDGDRLFGLGSADVKLDAACKLLAIARLAQAGAAFRRPFAFLGTHQEEVGCRGAKQLAASGLFPARYVLCGEPSALRLIDAHKGYAVVRVAIQDREAPALAGPFRKVAARGKAAHSSTPHLGESAILKGLPGLRGVARIHGGTTANTVPAQLESWIADPAGGEHLEGAVGLDAALERARALYQRWTELAQACAPKPDLRFDPPTTVTNWGRLTSSVNALECTFDCRLLPGQMPAALLDPFAEAATQMSDGRFEIRVEVDRANEAMSLGRPSALLDAAQASARVLGLDPEPMAKPTNTEAGVFAQAGAEAMVFGPGVSTGNAHCANEHTLLSQCRKAIDFYEALARRLCC